MPFHALHASLLLSAIVLAGCAASPASVQATAFPAFPASTATPATAATALTDYSQTEPLGAAMQGWAYPYPVQMYQFEHDGRLLRMAYMDTQPIKPNGQTVILFHGKNFGADYWFNTLQALSAKGYRVIAPDQVGFGKSSKPEIRYTFGLLADNTARLLDHLKVGWVAIVGNSMGGMLGVHFALRHPQRVTALVLENPLGLENYATSIAPQDTANLLQLEMAQTTTSYRAFIKTYFNDNYRPEFERFVEQFARAQLSSEYPRFAHVSALTYQMIHDGSVYNALPKLTVPTLLPIGQLDRTVFGRRFAPPRSDQAAG